MKISARLLYSTIVVAVLLPGVVFADDEPDFRTMAMPTEVYVLESPNLLKTLDLTGEQKEKLKAIFDKWETDYLTSIAERESSRKVLRPGGYVPLRANVLRDSISDLLDDQQHQLFHQMLTLWNQSPVRSHDAFRFELGFSDRQHLRLQELETKWVLHALKAPCDYRFARHTEPPDRKRFGKQAAYYRAVFPFGWQFATQRNAEWSRVLTAKEAKRWKERELQRTLQLSQFLILVVDLSPSRQGRRRRTTTGNFVDGIIPYFTPRFRH
jgi:hypothetical protein